jgi:PKD domain
MQYRTLRLSALFLLWAIRLIVSSPCDGLQISRAATVNLTPTLSVSPNPTRPTNGQTVTFTAVLQPSVRDAAFWFEWGDGTPASHPSSNASASHVFSQPGTFPVVAHARALNRMINSAPVQITVTRSPARDIPITAAQIADSPVAIGQTGATTRPSLSLTASSLEPRVNESVTFSGNLQPTPNVAVQYQFQWGDNTSNDWTSSPTATHVFTSQRIYRVVLVARAATPALEARTGAGQIQSQPVMIRVQPPVVTTASTLLLKANNTQPAAGQTVSFEGSLQPASGTPIEYLFDWRDGTVSGWSSSSVATHSFNTEGTFYVFLIARAANATDGTNKPQMIRSRPLAINVRPPAITHNLSLTSSVSQVQVGQTVNFGGSLNPPANRVRYQFNWGDQTQSNVIPEPNASHSYSAPGRYPVQLMAQVGAEGIQSNTVVVEVRDAPMYQLDLSANTSEITVGQKIGFIARLEPSNDAAQYRFFWNDGTPVTTTNSATVQHSFGAAGTYRVGLVGIVDGKQIKTNPVSVTVLPLPSAVSLIANPSSPEVNQSVEFHAVLQPENTQAEYQFNWGDGTSSDWSAFPTQGHVYTTSGTRSAFVVARTAKASVQSADVPITVRPLPTPPPPLPGSVSLTANPTHPELKQAVQFHATLQPGNVQAEYQFNWDDGTISDWSSSGTQTHAYTVAGVHSPFVVARTGTTSLQSAALSINVDDGGRGSPPTLSIYLDKKPEKPGDTAKVRATFESAEPTGAEYKFIFGDGQATAWSSARIADHPFQQPGAYTVQAVARLGTKERPSNVLIVQVPPPPLPIRWDRLVMVLLLLLGMAATAWCIIDPKIRVDVRTAGPRVSHVAAGSELVQRPELRLRVVLGEVNHHIAHTEETVIQR